MFNLSFRRAVLKDSFEGLRKQIPSSEDQRNSHLDVLRMAVKYVQVLFVQYYTWKHF